MFEVNSINVDFSDKIKFYFQSLFVQNFIGGGLGIVFKVEHWLCNPMIDKVIISLFCLHEL
jgi:hypothetical protein